MKLLYKILLARFIPIFILTLIIFVLIIQLVDLFANLWGYIQNEALPYDIVIAFFYNTPQSIWFSLPISLLFSISFTLGIFNTNNELIAIFGSGTPFIIFLLPLTIIAIFLSIGGFYFHENLVINANIEKNQLSRELLGQRVSKSNANIAVISSDERYIYRADYYNYAQNRLTGLTVVKRDETGNFIQRIDSEWADFSNEDTIWKLHRARISFWDEDNKFIREKYYQTYVDPSIHEDPEVFQRASFSIDELSYTQAKEKIEVLRRSGAHGYREALVDYYERFSFSLTPIIVALISFGTSCWFKKHIILMHLLSGLSISVLYFVLRMVVTLLSKQGYFPPLFGAWSITLFFLFIGIGIFSLSKT